MLSWVLKGSFKLAAAQTSRTFSTMVQRVAVIGAGAAGLCALRHLVHRPQEFQAEAYEKADRVGGTWIYTEETGTDRHGFPIHSSMYKNLKTNLPKEVMAFPDFPFEKDLPSFLTRSQVEDYLESYARHFGLYDHIKLETFVERVHPVTGNDGRVTWDVTVTDIKSGQQTTGQFDAVMVCNGHYALPLVPALEGVGVYEGEVGHSHDYRHPQHYQGRTVVCLGAAASGMDISQEVAQCAKKVYLSHHKAALQSVLPENLEQVPGIARVGPGLAVTFKDGRTVQADAVLLCTGYRFDFPFLSRECALEIHDERLLLYKHILHLDLPSLAFIGVCKTVCPFPQFHCQVLFTLATLTGQLPLPSRKEMEEDVERDFQERLAAGLPPRHAHTMGPRQWAYNDQLAKMAGIPPIPRNVQVLYDHVHETRAKNLMTYKSVNYELTGPETFRVLD